MCRKIKLFALLLALMTATFAQAKVIRGQVTDETGETIISASVVVQGTTIGTITDFDGNYEIDVPEGATTLVFSYIGLVTQELPIKGEVMNVVLRENSEVLEEVVVTGYGTTKKRDVVTAVASVSAEQLKDIPVTTAAEALQGKLSGVSVTTTEGSPDADVKIRVRGGTSLTQSSDPLYIVDGFPVSSIADIAPSDIASMDVLKDAAATAIYGAQGANGVIIITTKESNSDEDKMQFHVDYSGYVGWKRQAKKYEMMSNRDFALMQYEWAYMVKGEANLSSNYNVYFDPYATREDNGSLDKTTLGNISDILNYWTEQPATDWQRKTFGNTWGESMQDGDHQGFISNHSFSVSGGNKAATFNLSYNRIDDKGIMYCSNYARNNIAFKAKFKPVQGLTLNMTARYSNTNVLGAGTNTSEDAGSRTESRVRNAVAYTPLELLSKDASLLDDYESFGSMYDPITTIDHNYKYKVDNKWTLNGSAAYKFLKHYTLKAEVGYEGRYRDTDRYYGPTTYYSRAGDGFTNAGGQAGYGHVQVLDQRNSKLRNTNTFEYSNKWKSAHNFSLLLGEEQTWNKSSEDLFYGYGYEASYTGENVFNYLNQCMTKDYKNTIGATDNMLSFFGRANYDYMGRYYVTATFRADASTRFARGNQWGYFPSAAIAWRMSDEAWMENAQSWLSNLKFRFSYGTAGNNNVDLGYLYYDYRSSTASYMDGFTGTQLYDGGADKIAANSKLKWETTVTRDFGIDYGFFNERLSGAIDLYWNSTNDLIIKYKTSVGGYNYQYRNIGSTDNKGVEFSVKGIILDHKSKALSYGLTVDGNIAYNKNKITSLGGMDEYTIATGCYSSNYMNTDMEYRMVVGESTGIIYGYESDGWFTTEDFDGYNVRANSWYVINEEGKEVKVNQGMGDARPGMIKLKTDEEGKVVRKKIGCTMPVVTGGFNISAHVGGDAWGRVDFNANFTYSCGNDVLNLSKMDYTTITEKTKLRNLSSSVAYGQRYSLFTADGSYIPASFEADATGKITGDSYTAMSNALQEANANAVIYNPVCGNMALTDQYVEDGSYLRLSNLTIGYTLAKNWLTKAHIQNIRLYFQASNLFCVTKYTGADPEVDTRSKMNPLCTGVDFSAYPKARGFNVGLNIAF